HHPAVPPGRGIAPRTRVDLRHIARRENLLFLYDHGPASVATPLIGPDPRGDEVDGIDKVLWAVVADLPVGALGRVAANRQRRIDQQIEPIGGFLDLRAPLGPNHA